MDADSGTCGLVPIGRSCDNVTTRGLRWNVNNSVLSFGGLVSTSNEVIEENVTVVLGGKDDETLLWTSSFEDDAWEIS